MYFRLMVGLAVLGMIICGLLSLIPAKTVESKGAKSGLILGGITLGGFMGASAGALTAKGLESRVAAEKRALLSSSSNVDATNVTPKCNLS